MDLRFQRLELLRGQSDRAHNSSDSAAGKRPTAHDESTYMAPHTSSRQLTRFAAQRIVTFTDGPVGLFSASYIGALAPVPSYGDNDE